MPKLRRSVEHILNFKSEKQILAGEAEFDVYLGPPRILIPSTKNSQESRRKKTADPKKISSDLQYIEREVKKM